MKLPKMILFDYGQTLMAEEDFNRAKGTKALLEYAIHIPSGVTIKKICDFAEEMNRVSKRYDRNSDANMVEIHNHSYMNYLYEYFDIRFDITPYEREKIFWDNAAPAKPTRGVEKMLKFLADNGIRTAVLSNISYSGHTLKSRIREFLPKNDFEFIIATSEYMFRKPHPKIFELALRKANLQPQDVWYIGDKVRNDINGAGECGIYPLLYKAYATEKFEEPSVEHTELKDWSELMKIITELKQQEVRDFD